MKYKFEKKTNIEKYLLNIKPKYYPVIAFVLSAIAYYIALSILGLLDNGLYVISEYDLHHQIIPFIEYFCKVLRGEHSFWYSWSLWMGSGTIGTFAYYTLSPFNVIYLILGESHPETATGIVIILKVAFSAATYQIFISKLLKNQYFEMVLFSVMYSLCGFSVCYYFDIIYFDALYTLPVIMYSIMCLIRDNKKLPLVLSYAYLIGVNFYMGYIVGFSTFFIFVFCIIYKYSDTPKHELKKIIANYIGAVLIAVLMTAIIWLPTAFQFIELYGYENGAFDNKNFNLLLLVNNLFVGQMQSYAGAVPYVYSGILSLIALPAFIMNKHIKLRKRVCYISCLILFVLLMLIEPLNFFMHGFDMPNNVGYRYSFVVSFILITILSIQFMHICNRKKQGINTRVMLCVVFSCVYWLGNYQLEYFNFTKPEFKIIAIYFVNIFIILLLFYVIDLYRERKMDLLTIRTVFTLCVIVELTVNAYLCVNQGIDEFIMDFQSEFMSGSQEYTARIIKSEKGDDFYRTVYMDKFTYDIGTQNDIPSITSFSSLLNVKTAKAMQALGYGYTPNFMYGNGWTPLMNSILGVEYVIDGARITTDDPDIPVIVWPNEHYYQYYAKYDKALPLAYTVNNKILEYKFTNSVFENQKNLLDAMTGYDGKYYESVDMAIDADKGVMEYKEDKIIMHNPYYNRKESTVLFTNEKDDGRPMYANFYNNREIVNKKTPAVYIQTNNDDYLHTTYSAMMYPNQIVALGHNADGKSYCEVVVPVDEESIYYDKQEFVYYNESQFDKAYNRLKGNEMYMECFDDGYVKGSVNCDEDCVLFTSIPYEKSWNAYINGEKVETCGLVENGFVGLKLDAGLNDIVLEYIPRGMYMGAMLSILGCVFAGVIGIIDIRKKST